MSRTRRPTRRLVASILGAAIVSASCGGPTPSDLATPTASPSASVVVPVGPTDAPTAPPSSGPFRPMAWPARGEAPCGQEAPPDPAHAAYTGNLKRISATDERTVVLALCRPDAALTSRLAAVQLAIDDTDWLQSRIDPTATGPQRILTEVNGTGPYRLEAWGHGADLMLVRNEAYAGEPAKVERVVFRWVPDASQRLVELAYGSVDGVDALAPSDVGAALANVDLQVLDRPGLDTAYLGFNAKASPFDLAPVRQAISVGFDRAVLVAGAFPPGTEVASHFTPCSVVDGCAGTAWPEFDAAAGRDLLAGAGFPDGFKTTISYTTVRTPWLPDPTRVATAIAAALKANLGIEATLVERTPEELADDVATGRLAGIALLGFGIDASGRRNTDVNDFLSPTFGPSAITRFGDGFASIAKAVGDGRGTTDPERRTAAYAAANEAIRTLAPIVPLAHVGDVVAYRADVTGAYTSPLGTERFESMTPGDRTQLVWMQAKEPAGLYCADETGSEALRVCAQLTEGLYAHDPRTTAPVPALAEGCTPDDARTTWTCTLRAGVTFHDGAALDANDVVLSYAVQWDAEHPLHRGRDGAFVAFRGLFGGLLNPPATN